MTIQQALDSAIASYNAGNLSAAENICRQILAQQPNHCDALNLLGMIANTVNKPEIGAQLIRQAIAINPNIAAYHNNLANALVPLGKIEEAEQSYRRAIALQPEFFQVFYNLGNLLRNNLQFEPAIEAYKKAIALKPDLAVAHHDLGLTYYQLRRLDDAIAAYRNALQFQQTAQYYNNLGNILNDQGQLDEAAELLQTAVNKNPNFAPAVSNLGNVLKNQGKIDEAVTCYRKAVALQPNDSVMHSNLIFSLHYHPDYDSAALFAESREWSRRHAQPLKQFIQAHDNDRDPNRKLRIGYLSSDFREHVSAHFLLPLLAHHDAGQFEIVGYAQVYPDQMTQRLQNHCKLWRNIAVHSDRQVAEMIREDRIDLLVDLKLHSADNRLRVFAYKPAPLQVTWLGYPGTTGLDTIDYRLTDPHLDPPHENDASYSEQSIRLPETFWCYDPLCDEPAVNELPEQTVFGCLNNFSKVNERVLELWKDILSAMPEARMIILCDEGSHRPKISDRVEFVGKHSRHKYLQLYHRISIALDTFPYNGHTTGLDAMWMGVPTVTLVGKTAVGRAGLSQLANVGLTELAAHSPQEYVQIAVGLAKDRMRLDNLRATLRQRMKSSPLMDAPRFARNIEAAYRMMWRKWCER